MNIMNKITHHLSDQLLIGYSAGTLPEAFNLVVATHLSMCDECRAAAQSYDSVGGALLHAQTTEDLDAAALAKTMALIAKGPKVAPPATAGSDLPDPLSAYIGGGLSDIKWRPHWFGCAAVCTENFSCRDSAVALHSRRCCCARSRAPRHGVDTCIKRRLQR